LGQLRRELDIDHMLASQRIFTDGKQMFFEELSGGANSSEQEAAEPRCSLHSIVGWEFLTLTG